jgi:hypothetical protein
VSTKRRRDSHPRSWRRTLRLYFRRFRIAIWLILFVLLWVGIYLNQVGLPGFIKRPLLANLQKRGVELEYSRLRLRGYRGIVADDVRLAGMDQPTMPRFAAQSADVRLNHAALLRLKLEVEGVTLHNGELRWDLDLTNQPPETMAITNIMANVRFLPGDQWELDQFDALYQGARFHITGHVTNASRLPGMFRSGGSRQAPELVLARLRRMQAQLNRIHFAQPPEFRLTFAGDAAVPSSFNGVFTLNAPDANTPWGSFEAAVLTARLDAAALLQGLSAHISLKADQVTTEWAGIGGLKAEFGAKMMTNDEIECDGTLHAAKVEGSWTTAREVAVKVNWTHGTNEWLPRLARAAIEAADVSNRWATVESVALNVRLQTPAEPLAMNDPGLGVWNKLLPYAVSVTGAATNASARGLNLKSVQIAADWDAPRLVVTELSGELAGGRARLQADLDVLTRQLEFDTHAALDFHQFEPLLTEKSRDWLGGFKWGQAPDVALRGWMVWPAWTNREPDWRSEVQPGLVLAGRVAATNIAYRDIDVRSVVTHLGYSNRVWHLPDLRLQRPEGTLQVDLRSEELSHDFQIGLRGQINPRALNLKLKGEGHHGPEHMESTNAPWLDAQVSGNWYDLARLSAAADIAWTNFSYRGEFIRTLAASVQYSNHVIQVFHPRMERDEGIATAAGVLFDIDAQKAYLTNAYTAINPQALAWMIGPKVAEAVKPYQFLKPPVAHVYGVIPLKGEQDADLHFDLAGGPFHWTKFRLPKISGQVHWANESVTLTNIVTSFYGGEGRGHAWFDVRQPGSAPFHFAVNVTNVDLHALMGDLHSPTNQLEGTLAGELVVTSANTTNWNSWNGYGRASLRDGLIWDTPVFGVMSTVMNGIVPGIGNSRASEASGTYTISNSVLRTRDLDIRASGMRLSYNGTVDFETRVNARVEAELLRDTWVVGKLFSTALWPVSKLFEYRVTGTLADPQTEPVYFVPRLFLAPFQSMKSVGEMFQKQESGFETLPDPLLPLPAVPDETPAGTNAPTATPPKADAPPE